jgi:hypothetical protein
MMTRTVSNLPTQAFEAVTAENPFQELVPQRAYGMIFVAGITTPKAWDRPSIPSCCIDIFPTG